VSAGTENRVAGRCGLLTAHYGMALMATRPSRRQASPNVCQSLGCPPHFTVSGTNYGCCPIDVGALQAGQSIPFIASSDVANTPGSVRTTRISNVCADSSLRSTFGVLVDMYTGPSLSGRYIGSMLYAHLQGPWSKQGCSGSLNETRIADSSYNYNGYGGAQYFNLNLGAVVGCDYSESGCQCGTCARGTHTHVQGNGGDSPAFGCNTPLTGGVGGTWLYHWSF